MAVRLRLMRMGKKKQPTYRIVAADARSPRDGRFIEIVGTYNPRTEPSVIKVDNAKVVGWLREGAQPSDRVKKLLEVSGAWAAFKDGKLPEDLAAAQEAEAAAAAASEAAEVTAGAAS
ncbi:MAG: small subunit ribosomal protein S16 [Acidimicrobiales bacterium]